MNEQIPEWNEIKTSVMKEIIKAKIDQHEEVRNALQASGKEEIIENSPEDYFWGSGKDNTGRNELGKIWMEIREEMNK